MCCELFLVVKSILFLRGKDTSNIVGVSLLDPLSLCCTMTCFFCLFLSTNQYETTTGTAAAMKICCALFVHFPCKNNDIVGVSSLFMDSTPLLDKGMLILSNSLVNQTVWSSNNPEMLLFLVHFL